MLGVLFDASDDAGTALILSGFGAGLLLGPFVAWRSYRRRASGEFRVWPDRVEFVAAGGAVPIGITVEELDSISVKLPEGPRGGGRIELRGAGRRILLNEAWSLQTVALDLAASIVPALVEREAARIERGDTLEFKVPCGALLAPAAGALACAALLVFCAVQVVTRWGTQDAVEPKAAIFVALLVAGLVAAIRLLRRRWRGGVCVSKSGLRRPGGDFGGETPWSSVTRAEVCDGVFELASEVPPETWRFPMDGPNARVLHALAGRLVPPA